MADERESARPLARRDALDSPLEARRPLVARARVDPERFGRLSEGFARFMGTPRFLFYMSFVVVAWLAWNTFAPVDAQFDPRALNYTLLTLILSLQASYAAPLILLAQNRQADRDRVALEQDRQGAERNLADTEYLAREVAALRIALGDVATRDFVRSELRALLTELDRTDGGPGRGGGQDGRGPDGRGRDGRGRKKKRGGGGDGAREPSAVGAADGTAPAAPEQVPDPAPEQLPEPAPGQVPAPPSVGAVVGGPGHLVERGLQPGG